MTLEAAPEAVAANREFTRGHFPPHSPASTRPLPVIDEQQIKTILYLGIVGSATRQGAQGRNIDTFA